MGDPIIGLILGQFLRKAFNAAWDWAQDQIVNRVRRRGLSREAERIAHAFDVFSSARVRPQMYSIKGIGKLVRAEIDSVLNAWAGGLNCILLIGNAGTGKSGIAHAVAELLRKQGQPVLFVDASNLPSREDPVAYLGRILSLTHGIVGAFSTLGKEHDCHLILDQLDSVTGRDSLLAVTNVITSLSALSRVRVLVVSRAYEAEQDQEIRDLPCERMASADLQETVALRYLQMLGIDAPAPVIQALAVNLLNLSLIAEIADVGGSFAGVESETDLWVSYVDSIKQREGPGALQMALDLASRDPQEPGRELEAPLVPNRAIRRLLSRGVLISPFFGRLRFRHERLRDFLCAYRLLPRRQSPRDLHQQFGEHRGRAVVKWLHSLLHKYDQIAEARFVDDALGGPAGDLPFYTRAAILDVLKEQASPSEVVAAHLAKHLGEEIYQRYFFGDLRNPQWLAPLHRTGYFYRPPDPVETQPGYFRYPAWMAAAYLSVMAESHPDVLADVACNVNSQNAAALDTLLEGLVKIPPAFAARAAGCVAKWVPMFRGPFDPVRLGRFMGHLAETGYIQEALQILRVMTAPVIGQDGRSEHQLMLRTVRAQSSVDEYWLGEIWRQYGVTLVKRSPDEAAKMLAENLIGALELEQGVYGDTRGSETSSYWRSAIEDHPQNSSIYPLHDLLVDGLRDAVQLVCLNEPKKGKEILERYLASNHSILRRIAIYVLTEFGSVYSELLTKLCAARANLDNPAVHHEYFWLLAKQFPQLPMELRTQLVEWLFEGPEDTEAIATRITEREGPEKLEEELARYREYWTFRRIWAIRQYLDGDEKRRLDELSRRLGQPEHADFLSWSGGVHMIAHVSPLSQEELAVLPQQQIIEEIKKYVPPTPSVEHSREGLADALAGAVKAHPARFVGLAHQLTDEEVPLIYIYHYLAAMREGIERGEQFELDPILDLCIFTASLPQDAHEEDRDRYEPGLRVAQFEVANLVEALLKQEKFALDEDRQGRIRDLVATLLKNPDPPPEAELESGWDPATGSLNCVRGKAMHSLIAYARYQDRKATRQPGDGQDQRKLDPFVRAVLEEKLDKGADVSLAVHSVYGWYLPLIEYFDQHWLAANLARIFPAEPDHSGLWRAAWDAYVSFNNVYKRPFLLLVPQYRRAISLLNEPEHPGHLGTTRGQRLGQHLAYAYIHGLIDIEGGDGLLRSFYAAATDALRGHVAFWLAKAFGELSFKSDNTIWHRMWALMTWRVDVASKAGNVGGSEEEVSSFMRWLENARVGFEEMEPILRMAVPFLKEGYHKKLVADYLARYAAEFPRPAIEILHNVILRSEAPWFSLYMEDLETIIGCAVRSTDAVAVREAVAVINVLGERGDFRWKKYLPGQKEA